MATLATGRYIIKSFKEGVVTYLADPLDGTPVSANHEQNVDAERWNVCRLGNGRYYIQNVANANYANVGNRAPQGSTVEGRAYPQQWVIQGANIVNGPFTISTSDYHLYWGLLDGEPGTCVSDCPWDYAGQFANGSKQG